MYVYVIGCGDGLVKIGRAANVQKRLASLQTGNPHPLHIMAVEDCKTDELAKQRERELHQKMVGCRIRGEWFRLSEGDVRGHFSGEHDDFAERLAVYRNIVSKNSTEAVASICDYHGIPERNADSLATFLTQASFAPN